MENVQQNENDRQIARYKQRLEALYLDIKNWLCDKELSFDRKPADVDDGLGEIYKVDALNITGMSDEFIATVMPNGWNIIGAEGQVRIFGLYDTRIVSYFTDNGPSVEAEHSVNGTVYDQHSVYLLSGISEPGWYVITNPRTGATRKLDGDLLMAILEEVSDYGV